MNNGYLVIAGLGLVMVLVMFLPFSVRKVEEELEAFLLVMGALAATISGVWSRNLVVTALEEPLAISAVVLVAGLVFRTVRHRLADFSVLAEKIVGLRVLVFLAVLALGLASSLITAIVAALVLCEIAAALRLERGCELRFVICACYAIGIGAALTPIGEPLSAIAVARLKGPPHYADSMFLLKLLGWWVVPGVVALAAYASAGKLARRAEVAVSVAAAPQTVASEIFRAIKVYLFVAALVLLGAGLAPLAEMTVSRVPDSLLYWLNSLSAVLDNATLAAAELLPSMPAHKIKFLLMGLLVAGGMLVPGNIPNIISASRLNIRSREWAKLALPLGGVLMSVYFILLRILG